MIKDGRRFRRVPDPYMPPEMPDGEINITDPDSHVVKGPRGYLQGYNVQAVVNEQQIVIAAEVNTEAPSSGIWSRWSTPPAPTRDGRIVNSARRGRRRRRLPAQRQMDAVTAQGIALLIPPLPASAEARGPVGRRSIRVDAAGPRERARSDALRKRQVTIEPVFGQTKFNRGIDRFRRRGRAAVRSEWRLITASHNLLKLHSYRTATTGP